MPMIATLAATFVAFMTAYGDVKPPRPRPAAWELTDLTITPASLHSEEAGTDDGPLSARAAFIEHARNHKQLHRVHNAGADAARIFRATRARQSHH